MALLRNFVFIFEQIGANKPSGELSRKSHSLLRYTNWCAVTQSWKAILPPYKGGNLRGGCPPFSWCDNQPLPNLPLDKGEESQCCIILLLN